MDDSHPENRRAAGDSRLHLEGETLQDLVEGTLPDSDEGLAREHLAACARCAAELEAYTLLFSELGALPRLAPSAEFTDRVMARVEIAPRTSPFARWASRFVPRSTRGWVWVAALLALPASIVVASFAWLLAHPMVTARSLTRFAGSQARQLAISGLEGVSRWATARGITEWAELGAALVSSLPTEVLVGGGVLLAIAVPLSAWALIRLLRTPMKKPTYAN